jgi:hypothetical protein
VRRGQPVAHLVGLGKRQFRSSGTDTDGRHLQGAGWEW